MAAPQLVTKVRRTNELSHIANYAAYLVKGNPHNYFGVTSEMRRGYSWSSDYIPDFHPEIHTPEEYGEEVRDALYEYALIMRNGKPMPQELVTMFDFSFPGEHPEDPSILMEMMHKVFEIARNGEPMIGMAHTHLDTDNAHVSGMMVNVNADGTVCNIHGYYNEIQAAMRQVEQEYGYKLKIDFGNEDAPVDTPIDPYLTNLDEGSYHAAKEGKEVAKVEIKKDMDAIVEALNRMRSVNAKDRFINATKLMLASKTILLPTENGLLAAHTAYKHPFAPSKLRKDLAAPRFLAKLGFDESDSKHQDCIKELRLAAMAHNSTSEKAAKILGYEPASVQATDISATRGNDLEAIVLAASRAVDELPTRTEEPVVNKTEEIVQTVVQLETRITVVSSLERFRKQHDKGILDWLLEFSYDPTKNEQYNLAVSTSRLLAALFDGTISKVIMDIFGNNIKVPVGKHAMMFELSNDSPALIEKEDAKPDFLIEARNSKSYACYHLEDEKASSEIRQFGKRIDAKVITTLNPVKFSEGVVDLVLVKGSKFLAKLRSLLSMSVPMDGISGRSQLFDGAPLIDDDGLVEINRLRNLETIGTKHQSFEKHLTYEDYMAEINAKVEREQREAEETARKRFLTSLSSSERLDLEELEMAPPKKRNVVLGYRLDASMHERIIFNLQALDAKAFESKTSKKLDDEIKYHIAKRDKLYRKAYNLEASMDLQEASGMYSSSRLRYLEEYFAGKGRLLEPIVSKVDLLALYEKVYGIEMVLECKPQD